MTDQKLSKDKDWTVEGNAIAGRGEGRAQFRALQADLNLFGERLGFERVAIDGLIGPKTVAAVTQVVAATLRATPGLAATGTPPHRTREDVAEHAPAIRTWLLTFALGTLRVSPFRRYERGTGKDWNTKDTVAYGSGAVHEEFKTLQLELNRFAASVGFAPVKPDGMIGSSTAEAINKIYRAVTTRNPLLAPTPFPPPDNKEEAAEYASFIRAWLGTTAAKTVLPDT